MIDAIIELVDRQFERNTDVNLLGPATPSPLPESVEALQQDRDVLSAALDVTTPKGRRNGSLVADHMTARMIEVLSDVNQYVSLDEAERESLRRIYAHFVGEMGLLLDSAVGTKKLESAFRTLQKEHFERLSRFLTTIRDARLFSNLWDAPALDRVPSAQYSPELQLGVLGLSISDMVPPVLDIGCGREAGLVVYLQKHGIEAVGIDRCAPHRVGTCIRSDWLEFHYGKGRWGTVLSHMAFSNHFCHHHLRTDGKWFVYARTYSAILESITEGGLFAYAPAVSFVEAVLPAARFEVRSHRIQGEFEATLIRRTYVQPC